VTRVDAELVGRASVALGAGRDRVEDPVIGGRHHGQGQTGDEVRPGDPMLEMHYRKRPKLDAALALASRAVAFATAPPRPPRDRRGVRETWGKVMLGILQPIFGAVVILAIAVLCSNNRRAINWTTVAWACRCRSCSRSLC
jgi:hypothetical protein